MKNKILLIASVMSLGLTTPVFAQGVESIEDELSNSSILDGDLEDFEIDVDTGIVVLNSKINTLFGNQIAVESFGQVMWETLTEHHDNFPESVLFRGYVAMHGMEWYNINVYFSSETIKQIDFKKTIEESKPYLKADYYSILQMGDVDYIPLTKEPDDIEQLEKENPLYVNSKSAVRE